MFSFDSRREIVRLVAETVIDNIAAAALIEPESTTITNVFISLRVAFIADYQSNILPLVNYTISHWLRKRLLIKLLSVMA